MRSLAPSPDIVNESQARDTSAWLLKCLTLSMVRILVGVPGPAKRLAALVLAKLTGRYSARAACTAAMSSASSAGVTAMVERDCCECSEPSSSKTRARFTSDEHAGASLADRL
jgi:hypothetical protein